MGIFVDRRGMLQTCVHRDFDRELSIDIETFSANNLKKGGLHKYIISPEFEILLFAYAFDDGPVHVIDLYSGEDLSDEVVKALNDPRCLKKAWNAQFEFQCIQRHFGITLDLTQWECSMIRAGNLTLPLGLDAAAIALKAPFRKDPAGKALINFFCIPCKPTKNNNHRTRNLPEHRPDKWKEFIHYVKYDVLTERSIASRMDRVYYITERERELYQLDQRINAAGVKIDRQLVENAIKFDQDFREKLLAEARSITGLTNPNSVKKLREWLNREIEPDEDGEIETLKKADVEALLKREGVPAIASRVLRIRQMLGKSSVSKYKAMIACAGHDDRVCGLFQFYGAQRTGRWAGRLVQMQNLPRNIMKLLDFARETVRMGDYYNMCMMYENVPATLSQLVRTAFIPDTGMKFNVADFSAIEACVIAWLAGEQWRLDIFRNGGDIYLASAARMFKVDIDKLTKAYDRHESWAEELRQRGKVAELALGYGGSVGAIATMDTKKLIKPKDRQGLVDAWRAANPAIVDFWKRINNATIHCIETRQPVRVGCVQVRMDNHVLFIVLPSGRRLTYLVPRLGVNKFGGLGILYKGQNQKNGKWGDLETYGGKLTENIVQAIARDILGEAMLNLDNAGYRIVAHVHDEVILEVPLSWDCLDEISEVMTLPIEWAPGIPLKVKGFESMYYKKD